jgi:hypothetical protein
MNAAGASGESAPTWMLSCNRSAGPWCAARGRRRGQAGSYPDVTQIDDGDRHAGIEEGVHMRRLVVVLLGATVVLGGCATGEDWANWQGGGAHFASSDHLYFSVRNSMGRSPQVTRRDIEAARAEGWWGEPVTVQQDQILER